jgi:flagellar capping protein FliD
MNQTKKFNYLNQKIVIVYKVYFFEMSGWLEIIYANKFRQTYVKGFLDISGGDIINRTGSIKVRGDSHCSTLYATNGINLPSGDLQANLDALNQKINDLQNQINTQTNGNNTHFNKTDASLNSLQSQLNNYKTVTDSSLNTLTSSLNAIYEYFFYGDLNTPISH